MKRMIACDSNNCDSAARYSLEFTGGAEGPPKLLCTRCAVRYFQPKGFGVWELLSRENFGKPIFTVSIRKLEKDQR